MKEREREILELESGRERFKIWKVEISGKTLLKTSVTKLCIFKVLGDQFSYKSSQSDDLWAILKDLFGQLLEKYRLLLAPTSGHTAENAKLELQSNSGT